MRWKFVTWVGMVSLFIFIGLSSLARPSTGHAEALLEEMTFTGADFSNGSGHDFAVTQNGLIMADTAFTTIYTSPEIEAPIPFNAVVPQWRADLPEGSQLAVQMRTKTAVGPWSDWIEIHEQHDWMEPGDDLLVGEMITVPAADETHTHVQFSFSMSRYVSLTTPVVTEFTLTFIDSTDGPTVAEMVAQQQARDAAAGRDHLVTGVQRPSVISRDVWCIYDDCDYTAGLEYRPATHMVVHHTVSSNDSSDWAAVVRAIWNFHTYSRDWGDIGYNYLVDLDGHIYEGHMNEDFDNLDVIGTHAAGANSGSMGTALIGTFTAPDHGIPGIEPPAAMVDSLVSLLSWKADQRDIDVYDASDALPDINWGLPHLMGHRDTYGTTECPGDQAYALLPLLRDRVAANIGLTNDYLVIDERSTQLDLSDANWYEGPNECGTNGHSYYTFSTTNPAESTNWGVWRPEIPANGRYRIEVRVPYCNTGRAETSGAVYDITHAHGTSSVTVDQNAQVGLWITLGEFDLTAGTDNTIRLSDLTSTDDGLGVWFDDMRLQRLSPQLSNVAPADTVWLNDRAVTFEWALSDSSAVQTSTLQVATTETLTTPLVHQTWSGSRITHTHTFTRDYAALYWQTTAVLSDTAETITSPVTHFGIDTAVPTSTVTALYKMPDSYLLKWQGSDALSGVAGFDISYRTISETTWTPWITGTTAVSAHFTPPDPDETVAFRVQATDNAGNVEPKTAPDTTTDQAIDLPHAIMLPMISKQ